VTRRSGTQGDYHELARVAVAELLVMGCGVIDDEQTLVREVGMTVDMSCCWKSTGHGRPGVWQWR